MVIGEASTAPELLEQADKHRWNVIVLDLTMPGRSGLDALHELKAEHPSVPVLVLSMHPEDQFAVRVLRAGAAGYLTKENIPEGLVQTVRKIMAGGKYIRSSVADLLATQLQQGDATNPRMPSCRIVSSRSSVSLRTAKRPPTSPRNYR